MSYNYPPPAQQPHLQQQPQQQPQPQHYAQQPQSHGAVAYGSPVYPPQGPYSAYPGYPPAGYPQQPPLAPHSGYAQQHYQPHYAAGPPPHYPPQYQQGGQHYPALHPQPAPAQAVLPQPQQQIQHQTHNFDDQLSGALWQPSSADSVKLEQWFSSLDSSGRGIVMGQEIVAFLTRSNLPRDTLRTIWALVDNSELGYVNKTQFNTLIRLVSISSSPIYAGAAPSMERFKATLNDDFPLPSSLDIVHAHLPQQLTPPKPELEATSATSSSPVTPSAQQVAPHSPISQHQQQQAQMFHSTSASFALNNTAATVAENDDDFEFTEFTSAHGSAITAPTSAALQHHRDGEEDDFDDFVGHEEQSTSASKLAEVMITTEHSAVDIDLLLMPSSPSSDGAIITPAANVNELSFFNDNTILESAITAAATVEETNDSATVAATPDLPHADSHQAAKQEEKQQENNSKPSTQWLDPSVNASISRLSVFDELAENDLKAHEEDWDDFAEANEDSIAATTAANTTAIQVPGATASTSAVAVNPFEDVESDVAVPVEDNSILHLSAPTITATDGNYGQAAQTFPGDESNKLTGAVAEEDDEFGDFAESPKRSDLDFISPQGTAVAAPATTAAFADDEEDDEFGDFEDHGIADAADGTSAFPASDNAVEAPTQSEKIATTAFVESVDLLDFLSDDVYVPNSSQAAASSGGIAYHSNLDDLLMSVDASSASAAAGTSTSSTAAAVNDESSMARAQAGTPTTIDSMSVIASFDSPSVSAKQSPMRLILPGKTGFGSVASLQSLEESNRTTNPARVDSLTSMQTLATPGRSDSVTSMLTVVGGNSDLETDSSAKTTLPVNATSATASVAEDDSSFADFGDFAGFDSPSVSEKLSATSANIPKSSNPLAASALAATGGGLGIAAAADSTGSLSDYFIGGEAAPASTSSSRPIRSFKSESEDNASKIRKPLTVSDLELLSLQLSERHLYEDAYNAMRQTILLRSINELMEQKQTALENDDLEQAVVLKKKIALSASELEGLDQEELWEEAARSNRRGDTLKETAELISLIAPAATVQYKERYLDNMPSENAPLGQRMEFFITARRSARMIVAINSTHTEHPHHWYTLLKAVLDKIKEAKMVIAHFKSLSRIDKADIKECAVMNKYASALVSIAEVGMWVSASCKEAMVHAEFADGMFDSCSKLLMQIQDMWGVSSQFAGMTLTQLTLVAARLSERPGVVYCSATLRPLQYKLKKRKLDDKSPESIKCYPRYGSSAEDSTGDLIMEPIINLWGTDISPQLPNFGTPFS